MIDLMSYSATARDTEVSYIRRERDWAERAMAEGRLLDRGRLLPVLPASVGGEAARAGGTGGGDGSHAHGNGATHAHHK
jgi:hypothetical protein